MENLNALKIKRTVIKSTLTKFKTYYDEIVSCAEVNDKIICGFQSKLKRADSLFNEYLAIQLLIEQGQGGDGEYQYDEKERDSFEKSYDETVPMAHLFVDSYKQRHTLAPYTSGTTERMNPSPNSSSIPGISVKLPVMNLPRFNGSYENWMAFKDGFTSLVGKNQSLTDVQKLYYLKSCLSGEAERLIDPLTSTDANYLVSWSILVERYDHKRLIIYKHIETIIDIEEAKKESAAGLRHLIETVGSNIKCLKTWDQPTDEWDTLIICILRRKLDSITRREWENSCSDELPTLTDFLTFLRKKCQILETLNNSGKAQVNQTSSSYQKKSFYTVNDNKGENNKVVYNKCTVCSGNHLIYNCEKFLALSSENRHKRVTELKLCYKCLRNSHSVAMCRLNNCRICNGAHSTLLHKPFTRGSHQAHNNKQAINTQHGSMTPQASTSDNMSITGVVNHSQEVLLSTAVVHVLNIHRGESENCRVLLDSGSQSNFISEELCNKLVLQREVERIQIVGINGLRSQISKSAVVTINSRVNNYSTTLKCLVVPTITGNLPIVSFPKNQIIIPAKFNLADPQFNTSGKVDMLIGADVFYDILGSGKYKLGNNMPVLQNTSLGWIVGGNLNVNQMGELHNNHCRIDRGSNQDMDCLIAKLWEDETVLDKRVCTKEENICENHFIDTVRRDERGRFIVTMPFKESSNQLGESRALALKRFYALERKLYKNNILQASYAQFMKEYIELGHMRKICEISNVKNVYYIPHHPVINNNSSTTKLRVVFDASMKTDTGLSLNDIQMVGPTIQSNLFQLLTRFRQHRIVLTADIEKMYRQIKINEQQQSLQRIFWRESVENPIDCYELLTVTYGLASAPFLAIRSLFQLGIDYAGNYPEVADIIKNDFYVDDLLTGADSVSEANKLMTGLNEVLLSAGFQLRKWASNEESLVKFTDNQQLKFIGDVNAIKTLGIWWNPKDDILQYTCDIGSVKAITKRIIVSTTAKLFDPFGLVCPVIIQAKFMIQEAWKLQKSWDEELPVHIGTKWKQFIYELPQIHELKIARRSMCSNASLIELHGFSDASEQGYGACIYIRSKPKFEDQWSCKLLCAKAKVAPLKTITLARLELNAAVLLSRLVKGVRESLNPRVRMREYFWCDSTIVLAWINSPANKWKIYVAHRVSEIQDNSDANNWHHVKSADNPADLITRGASIVRIKESRLWWAGPSWLAYELDARLRNDNSTDQAKGWDDYLCEQRASTSIVTVIKQEFSLINKFSSYTKLLRVTAYCKRFIFNCRNHISRRLSGYLVAREINESRITLVKMVQSVEFAIEIVQLKKGCKVEQNSKLKLLAPMLDNDGILRVGGRLALSELSFGQKHPILLPKTHKLTELIVRAIHINNLHCGPQALLALIRETFWPIGGRDIAKRIVHNCITCFKCQPVSLTTEAGQLPKTRVSQAPPFYNTGVDFAGPFMIKDKRSRGNKIIKSYVCLFVCFAVKAIHLELVSDLSTEAFLAALRRFIARRGIPKTIYSDNATNFRGAHNELMKMVVTNSDTISNALVNEGINWRFIPPRSPHFGGIWEAGVKSVKKHLIRVTGSAGLVYEELCTVLAQIEAVLNSRPLCPLSNDPNDLTALTPAHFLIGRTLTGAPDVDVQDVQINRLSRFQRVQQLQQHFWSRWSREYVSQLQQRPRNRSLSTARAFKEGSLVIVREEGIPPLMWNLGRITELYPGKDGVVRVVNVRTQRGVVKREIRKICVLPIEQD